jgi:hypothetical protein
MKMNNERKWFFPVTLDTTRIAAAIIICILDPSERELCISTYQTIYADPQESNVNITIHLPINRIRQKDISSRGIVNTFF